jgi:hypothetical protein
LAISNPVKRGNERTRTATEARSANILEPLGMGDRAVKNAARAGMAIMSVSVKKVLFLF